MEALKSAADKFAEVVTGSGWGESSGWGWGESSGWGWGESSGWGWGESSGWGWGESSGDGSGEGEGWGSGSASGWGLSGGVKSFCGQKIYQIDGVPTLLNHVHGNAAKGRILRADLTTEACYIVRQGNLFAHGKTLRAAMDALRDKLFEDMPEEERIAEFVKAHEWGKQYPSADYYDWHHRLTGSCDMGRSEFAKRHGYRLTDDELLTVEEFIKLTENSYGGSVIRKLREAYKEEAT